MACEADCLPEFAFKGASTGDLKKEKYLKQNFFFVRGGQGHWNGFSWVLTWVVEVMSSLY